MFQKTQVAKALIHALCKFSWESFPSFPATYAQNKFENPSISPTRLLEILHHHVALHATFAGTASNSSIQLQFCSQASLWQKDCTCCWILDCGFHHYYFKCPTWRRKHPLLVHVLHCLSLQFRPHVAQHGPRQTMQSIPCVERKAKTWYALRTR